MHGNDEWRVVINHEEQYSIWPAERELPSEWTPVGKSGTREACMRYFMEKVWTDMRPLILTRVRQ
jgi:MbtH protein